ncbi:MAG: ABC transporter ATP-binding protein [Solirubrobacterales bacterium]
MLKLIKYLKPFSVKVFIIVILLLVQAFCDLSLPDYTSNIINTGIQQGGIEKAVPMAIRKSELDKLLIFMNEDEKTIVSDNYNLMDSKNMNQADLKVYLKQYPRLSEEPIYILNTKDKKVINQLNTIMGKPILAVYAIEKSGGLNLPKGIDLKANIEKKFSGISQSMITQGAVSYIKAEYDALGVNTNKLQSNYILYQGGIMLLIAMLSMAASVIAGYYAARVSAGLGMNLRRNVFRRVAGFSNSEFDKFSTASLITRSTNDIQQVQMLMVMLLRIAFYAPLLAVGGVIKVYNDNSSMWWIIALAVLAILSLVGILFGIAIPKFKSIQKLVDRLNLVTREILTGILVIRAFSTQGHEENKFDTANRELTNTNLFVSRVMSAMMPLMILIMNGTTLLIIWVGAKQVDIGAMQVGNMMAFIQYAMQIIMGFLMISMVSIMLPRATVAAARIDEVLETDFSIRDVEKPKHLHEPVKGIIEFQNVSFRYPGAEEEVLSNISFLARPGETTAFIGSTGSGKTTLINLIPRFYDVTSGKVLIDGIDVREIPTRELRDMIGYVPQKGVLFSGTIKTNISYGVENAGDAQLEKAAEISQALDFIKDKPKGFNEPVSQGGTNVSGGQKQRLAIARALIKSPRIFIFDDSFSALDYKTDAMLRSALKKETKENTVLIVGQRISTIINAERIIVLEDGKIAGIGTHKELMENCEVYQQIAMSQLSKEELV